MNLFPRTEISVAFAGPAEHFLGRLRGSLAQWRGWLRGYDTGLIGTVAPRRVALRMYSRWLGMHYAPRFQGRIGDDGQSLDGFIYPPVRPSVDVLLIFGVLVAMFFPDMKDVQATGGPTVLSDILGCAILAIVLVWTIAWTTWWVSAEGRRDMKRHLEHLAHGSSQGRP